MTEPIPPENTAPAAPVEKSGVFDDLVEITFSPRQVFTRRKTAGFGMAFFIIWILFTVVSLGSRSVYEPVMEAEMAKARAKMAETNPNITAEQTAMVEKVGGFFATASAIIAPPMAMLLLGLGIWLVGQVFGGGVNAGQGMLIATYAYVPRFLAALAILGLSFVTDMTKLTNVAQLSFGPGRFLDPVTTNPTLLALLSRIDVFVLWGTALIAIGYMTIGKASSGKAWGAAIVLWVLGGLPLIFGALAQ